MLMESNVCALLDHARRCPWPPVGATRVEEALETIAAGGMVIVVDDESRENEGDLIAAADLATPETLAFMVNHTTGIVCVAMDDRRADALGLPLMVAENADPLATAFTVTCDAAAVGTGVSAQERAATIRRLGEPDAGPGDFRRPGHIFPLRARRAGVHARAGHTEAAYDLARLARRAPVGMLSELVRPDGAMMRRPDIDRFSQEHGLQVLTIEELVAWRVTREMDWLGR
ncbi:MAG: 3,4-dihydroxy-2-butanone-4-phosphate synthase [Pseudomonadota bacterium]